MVCFIFLNFFFFGGGGGEDLGRLGAEGEKCRYIT